MAKHSRSPAALPPLPLPGETGYLVARSTVVSLLITASRLAQGVFLAWLCSHLAKSSLDDRTIELSLSGFFGLILVRAVLVWVDEWAAADTAGKIKTHLRQAMLNHLFTLGPILGDEQASGDLQTTLVSGIEAIEGYISRYLPAVLGALIGCSAVILTLALTDGLSALILGLSVIAFPLLDRLWMRWNMPAISGVFAAMGRFASYFLDSLQGMTLLKTFDAVGRRRSTLATYARELRQESMATLSVTMMRTGITTLITLSGLSLMLGTNIWRLEAGAIAPITLLLTLFLAREAFRPLERMNTEFHSTWAASGATQTLRSFLAISPPVRDPASPQPCPKTSDITFDAVSFRYPNAASPTLTSVTFTIEDGQSVAVMGPSGAGKSTLLNLLLRFFDPDQGSIRIGGTDLRDMTRQDLRSHISVVSQHAFFFPGTIAENLLMAAPKASLRAMQNAAHDAQIGHFIESLPHGYDTPIGEHGSSLSGGQRQRLAIARALLKNAPILILDEATAHVDPLAEQSVVKTLAMLRRGRTTLAVTHRVPPLLGTDRILLFEQGRLVGSGSQAALSQTSSLFAQITTTEEGTPCSAP